MKSPQPDGAPPVEISIEELEALVEQARAALPEDGYQNLLQQIRHVAQHTDGAEQRRKRVWRICASCCVRPRPRKRRRC